MERFLRARTPKTRHSQAARLSVEDVTGLSKAQILRLERLGRFPARVPISERSRGWLMSEVEQWVRDRAAERGGEKQADPRDAGGRFARQPEA
jgi:prophage regulatory protein